MCNLYTQTKSVDEVARIFREMQIPLSFPDGIPNLEPRDIAITDPGPIVRAAGDSYELVVRRWSWPGPGGKPVYNFSSGRCLIVADGFYEFTAPADPKQKRKDRWLFTLPGGAPIGLAGLVRAATDVGEAYTMLTCPPGPDVAPTHDRQVAVLQQSDWKAWLDYSAPAAELIRTLPAGSLEVRAAPR
jgi:putative SOS response-associated peptidase YedK